MLQNAYFIAKIGADTAENEQHFAKKWQHLAKNCPRGGVRGPRAASGEAARGPQRDVEVDLSPRTRRTLRGRGER